MPAEGMHDCKSCSGPSHLHAGTGSKQYLCWLVRAANKREAEELTARPAGRRVLWLCVQGIYHRVLFGSGNQCCAGCAPGAEAALVIECDPLARASLDARICSRWTDIRGRE